MPEPELAQEGASVEGAPTPTDSRLIAPGRSRSMSSIESAPATMAATSADTFGPAA